MELKNDTLTFIKEHNRMCNYFEGCECCPLDCECICSQDFKMSDSDVEKVLQVVQDWSDNHPRKTYKRDFFEKFPYALRNAKDCPTMCVGDVYGSACMMYTCTDEDCVQCWNRSMEEN